MHLAKPFLVLVPALDEVESPRVFSIVEDIEENTFGLVNDGLPAWSEGLEEGLDVGGGYFDGDMEGEMGGLHRIRSHPDLGWMRKALNRENCVHTWGVDRGLYTRFLRAEALGSQGPAYSIFQFVVHVAISGLSIK